MRSIRYTKLRPVYFILYSLNVKCVLTKLYFTAEYFHAKLQSIRACEIVLVFCAVAITIHEM